MLSLSLGLLAMGCHFSHHPERGGIGLQSFGGIGIAPAEWVGFHRALFGMNKRALIKKILAQLTGDLALYHRAALTARAEATDEQSKAENKYDTRGLEASYLARGQSMQAADTERTMQQFETMHVRGFGATDGIDVGALVELEGRGERAVYFMGPGAGGTEVEIEKREVLVITPQSPLGQQLVGRKQGDKLKLTLGGGLHDYRVVSVS